MGRWGDVFGIGFGVEAWAFFLEAVLIAIYLYGWRRLKPRTHFLLGLPLPATALLGAFGILAANSWMNTPQGFSLERRRRPGRRERLEGRSSPRCSGRSTGTSCVAMLLTAGYMVAGVYAVGWLRGRRDHYHRLGFAVPVHHRRDRHSRAVRPGRLHRPVGVPQAAGEVRRDGDRLEDRHPGTGVPLRPPPPGRIRLGRHQDPAARLLPGRLQPEHQGGRADLRPGDERPTATQSTIAHWAFDIMVGIGSVLVLLALWYGLVWLRHRRLPGLQVVLPQRGVRRRRLRGGRRMRLDRHRGGTPALDRLPEHERRRGGDLDPLHHPVDHVRPGDRGVRVRLRIVPRRPAEDAHPLAARRRTAGGRHPADAPEAVTPYGPRAPSPAATPPAAAAAPSGGGRP